MENVQLDIFAGRSARDAGMEQAAGHADAVMPAWNEKAFGLLKEFLALHAGPFMAEDVRSYAAMIDFPLPPHARAWGGIMARAAKGGLIKQTGIGKVKNSKAHCANAAVWVAVNHK